MNIKKTVKDGVLIIALEGRLNTTTAPELDAVLKQSIQDSNELIFDFSGLEYVSSAGLRVLLSAQKRMSRQGTMSVTHVNDTIMQIFDDTGFVDILTIQ